MTLLYAAATLCVAAVSIRGPFPSAVPGRERWLWLISAVLLLVLTLNKQLDLQSFVIATGRCVSRDEGWYDLRRAIQREVSLGLVFLVGVLGIVCGYLFRRTIRANRLLIVGMSGLIAFVVIRAMAFNHMDQVLGTHIAAAGHHRAVEALALTMILCAALVRLKRPVNGQTFA